MARMFFTSAEALARNDGTTVEEAASAQMALGLIQGMPFMLEEDGTPLRAINSWLRLLPSHGARSPKTWKAYALDLIDWHEFLEGQGSGLLEASRDDLAAYHAQRRLGDGGTERLLSASSWNRKITAIEGFYEWAVEEGLVAKAPFSYRYARVALETGGHTHMRTNLAKEKTGRAHANLKWLEEDQLATFLNVGLTGLLPDGKEDPSFRGRNAARNRAAAELMATVGLRVQEAESLLVTELPAMPEQHAPFLRMHLPAPVCKGEKERWVLMPPETLREITSYINLERAAVAQHGRYDPTPALPYTDLTATSVCLPKKTKLEKLSLPERQALVAGGSSPIIFLARDGAPIRQWQQVFEKASSRCQSFDPTFPDVTPHTLRHTFAVHMLRKLIAHVAQAVGRQVGSSEETSLFAGYWRIYDPLLTLRDLMGHASVSTTQIYLSAIDATRWYANFMEEENDG